MTEASSSTTVILHGAWPLGDPFNSNGNSNSRTIIPIGTASDRRETTYLDEVVIYGSSSTASASGSSLTQASPTTSIVTTTTSLSANSVGEGSLVPVSTWQATLIEGASGHAVQLSANSNGYSIVTRTRASIPTITSTSFSTQTISGSDADFATSGIYTLVLPVETMTTTTDTTGSSSSGHRSILGPAIGGAIGGSLLLAIIPMSSPSKESSINFWVPKFRHVRERSGLRFDITRIQTQIQTQIFHHFPLIPNSSTYSVNININSVEIVQAKSRLFNHVHKTETETLATFSDGPEVKTTVNPRVGLGVGVVMVQVPTLGYGTNTTTTADGRGMMEEEEKDSLAPLTTTTTLPFPSPLHPLPPSSSDENGNGNENEAEETETETIPPVPRPLQRALSESRFIERLLLNSTKLDVLMALASIEHTRNIQNNLNRSSNDVQAQEGCVDNVV
ncbi:hypothetical protein K435DRAFT_798748 [Dendrothele bispora CBS 962.96]|uniref:Uncharacterized protein n=1 Tax=Dendrothele bispora (strain CBS 962.96) TaxID=1314807 RepID=A0A4S8LY45_DENBC|nr:hypothetical protein K435DRAFT_798748 [Dendrothele bispora CBS 962.96]